MGWYQLCPAAPHMFWYFHGEGQSLLFLGRGRPFLCLLWNQKQFYNQIKIYWTPTIELPISTTWWNVNFLWAKVSVIAPFWSLSTCFCSLLICLISPSSLANICSNIFLGQHSFHLRLMVGKNAWRMMTLFATCILQRRCQTSHHRTCHLQWEESDPLSEPPRLPASISPSHQQFHFTIWWHFHTNKQDQYDLEDFAALSLNLGLRLQLHDCSKCWHRRRNWRTNRQMKVFKETLLRCHRALYLF